jgi:hypothetical protein
MGGTGALRFCGKHNLQLIVSKRDPQIFEKNNKGKDIYWGFTVIRRDDPIEGVKFSSYKYLAPNGKILRFLSHELNLLPGQYPKPYEKPLEFGTFVKLYDYKLPSGLKTNILFDLNYRLAVLLPNLALPVTLYERREKYKGHTFNTLLSGLSVRLEQDPSSIIENGFPNSSSITLKGQEIKLQIYVFKKETETKHFKKDEGIIFTINGQSHGSISKSFFTRKSAGMSYLSESILIIADCSNLERRVIEDLFMNSRDRLSDGDLKKEIEEKLEYLIKNHQGLRELRERRLHDEASSKVEDEKPLVETIQNVIKNSPSLTKLFITGEKISIPFKGENAGTSDEPIKFKQYPTYFRLKKEYPRDKPKNGHINQKFRIFFETDARNDYSSRDEYPGEFRLSSNGNIIKEYSLNLWNGITSLSADLPEIDIGSIIEYDVVVNDQTQDKPFESKFFVIVLPEIEENPGGKGRRVKPPGGEGNKRERPARLELPKVIPVYEKEWGSHGFDRESGLDVIDAGEESGYLFYVNMDNIYLKTQIKEKSPIEPNILVKQYEYGMVLIGLSILRLVNEEEENVEQKALFDNIKKVTRAISPMLLPMINSLGELKIE